MVLKFEAIQFLEGTMSYKLLLMHSNTPVKSVDVQRIYDKFSAGEQISHNIDPKINKFLEQLKSDFPEKGKLSGTDAETSPWAEKFVATGSFLVLDMVQPSSSEMMKYVNNMANRSGLIVFDPQEKRTYLPLKLEFVNQLPLASALLFVLTFLWFISTNTY